MSDLEKTFHCPWCDLPLKTFSKSAPGRYTRKMLDDEGIYVWVVCNESGGCDKISIVSFSDNGKMFVLRFTEEMIQEMDPATRIEWQKQVSAARLIGRLGRAMRS